MTCLSNLIDMRKTKYVILFFIIFLSFHRVIGQDESSNNKLKTLLIYNFTKYINWPTSYKTGNFIIAVLGDDKITPELKKMLNAKLCGDQQIEIREYPMVEHITKCHILYIPTASSNLLPKVMNAVQGKSILIITEKNGLINDGACINFVQTATGKIGFELNMKETENRSLNVNNTLSNQMASRVVN